MDEVNSVCILQKQASYKQLKLVLWNKNFIEA